MGPTVYPDQNVLIHLYEESGKSGVFENKLNKAIGDGRFKIILSPWHWVETAQTQNLGKALPLAGFMDRLQPNWLRDRRHLRTTEVETKFFQFVGIPYVPLEAIVTKAELLTEMNGFPVTQDRAPSSVEFVDGWIKNPNLMIPVIESYKKNMQALISLREAISVGMLTPDMLKAGDRQYIERHLPNTTPNGVLLDAATKNAFLDRVTQNDFPTLAIESEIAEYSWANRGRVDWNSMIDKFHVISSVHYADIVVSDDRFIHLLLPAAQKTGYVKATVAKFKQFCRQFLP